MKTTFTINGNTITCDSDIAPLIVSQLCGAPAPVVNEPAKAPSKTTTSKPKAQPITPKAARGIQWYDEFKSANTTVTPMRDTVQVKVARGHADEWHDRLRAAGFKWSKKGFWWAYNDSKKRSAVAERNIANDSATAGMTKDERRAYWQERNASRARGMMQAV